jgi:hypothetical protein
MYKIQKNKFTKKFKEKILFIFWLILLINIIRYILIIIGKPDDFAFTSTEQTQWNSILLNSTKMNIFINLISRFSKQSSILLFIIVSLKLLNYKKKWLSYLTFIGTIDILLSGLVYNITIDKFYILKNFYNNYNFITISFFEHIYFPICFLIFFLFFNLENIPLNKIYVAFIHPFYYFFIFIIISLIKPTIKYPYSFIDPNKGKCLLKFLYNKEPKGWFGVFINVFLVSIVIILTSYLLIKLKEKLSKKK